VSWPPTGGNWEGGRVDAAGQRWTHVAWVGWVASDAPRALLRPAEEQVASDDDSFINDCGNARMLFTAVWRTLLEMWRHRGELRGLR
jgi:hypothetical protein